MTEELSDLVTAYRDIRAPAELAPRIRAAQAAHRRDGSPRRWPAFAMTAAVVIVALAISMRSPPRDQATPAVAQSFKGLHVTTSLPSPGRLNVTRPARPALSVRAPSFSRLRTPPPPARPKPDKETNHVSS